MTDRFATILIPQFGKARHKGTEFGVWLRTSLVPLLGYTATDNIPGGVAGKVQSAAYLPNFLPISKMGLMNFTDLSPRSASPLLLLPLVDFQRVWSRAEGGQF